MDSLTITGAALEVIRRRLAQSSEPNPVVYLIQATDPIEVPLALGKAILSGADQSTIRNLASKALPEDWRKLRKRLVPAIYPREQFPRKFLIIVEGIPFVFPPNVKKKLKSWTLDVDKDGLVLKDASGGIVMPSNRTGSN